MNKTYSGDPLIDPLQNSNHSTMGAGMDSATTNNSKPRKHQNKQENRSTSDESAVSGTEPGAERIREEQQSSDQTSPDQDMVQNLALDLEDQDHGELQDPDIFSATFTNDKGGLLQKKGSDVVLRVPKGAVPEGLTYRIEGRIDTNLPAYNHLMRSEDEFITGPIPEYRVMGGGKFNKPVHIEIPVCAPANNRPENTRVLFQEDGNCFKVIPGPVGDESELEDMTYTVKEDTIFISTTHFTRFICTYHGEEDVTDAMLVVYASSKFGTKKTIVKLRVMMHLKCAGQNDFSSQRDEFLDPGMAEVVKQKIVLPVGTVENPQIVCRHVIHDPDDSRWKLRTEGGLILTPSEKCIDGQCMCFSGPNHRSEQLADFCLENPDTVSPPMLNCHVTVKLNNLTPDGTAALLEENLIIDYKPVDLSRSRTNSKIGDIDNEWIKDIAGKLGGEGEYTRFGINLGVDLKMIEEIKNKHDDDSFTRYYRLLDYWKKKEGDAASEERLKQALERTNRQDIIDDMER